MFRQLVQWFFKHQDILFGRIKALQRIAPTFFHYRLITLSWASRISHKFLIKVVLIVAIGFTAYALLLFATSSLAPNRPKPSHDLILKARFSSPAASNDIVILDIDERSLAMLAGAHGRWPWPRDVLADGLQKLADAGARGILFNVLLSDPDLRNADGDAAMEISSQMVRQAAFPLIRLNPENDKISQLKLHMLPGMIFKSDAASDVPLAAILPMFPSMRDRLGVANQKPDDDGIVRGYPLTWKEASFEFPSIVSRTLAVAGHELRDTPSKISLNWRNKKGRYQRVSFADFLAAPTEDQKLAVFKDAIVVVGVSAPGLGQTKATSVTAIEDDNEILATALDDAFHGTYLRVLPDWLILFIDIASIWIVVWLAVFTANGDLLNKAFALGQSALGGITLLSASYTYHLVDLSESMTFALGVFSAIKILQSLDDSWSRAKPGFRKGGKKEHYGRLVILGFSSDGLSIARLQGMQRSLESVVGSSRVVRIDDLFGGGSCIKPVCKDYCALLTLADDDQLQRITRIISDGDQTRAFKIEQYDLNAGWYPDNLAFQNEVAPLVVGNCAQVMMDRFVKLAPDPN